MLIINHLLARNITVSSRGGNVTHWTLDKHSTNAHDAFFYIECICNAWFTIEIFVRCILLLDNRLQRLTSAFFRCFANSVCQPCFFAFKWLSAQKRLLQNIQTQVLPDEDVGEDNDDDFGKLVVAQAMGDLSHELRKLWKLIHLNRHKKLSIKTEIVINWNLQKTQRKYNKEFDIGHEFSVEEKN